MNQRTAKGTNKMRIHRSDKSCWMFAALALALANSNIQAQVGSWQMEIGSGQLVLDFTGKHNGVGDGGQSHHGSATCGGGA